jgi:hypothetical protein
VAKKPAPKTKKATAKPKHHENIIERIGDVIEERFLEGAEMATETTSSETNVALAALAAIEGPRDTEPKARAKPADDKRKPATARRKKR